MGNNVVNGKLSSINLKTLAEIFRYLRMSPEKTEHLFSLLAPLISKENTKFRESIPPRKRLVTIFNIWHKVVPSKYLV